MAIELWELAQRQNGNVDGAEKARGLREQFGDVSLPSSDRILTLERARRIYKENLTSPKALTDFMRAFWQKAGEWAKMDYSVSEFPSDSKEIKNRIKEGQMAVCIPPELNYLNLCDAFDKMSWLERYSSPPFIDIVDNRGWVWIESSIDPLNINASPAQMEGKFNKGKRQGQSLKTYVVGREVSSLLTNKYFDQGGNYISILLGTLVDGETVGAHYHMGGIFIDCGVCACDITGYRSEEKVKA
jgi:hypothetical protein